MSIAITTVLPEPVAILKAMRGRPGFDVSLASRARSRSRRRRTSWRDLGEVDRRFERLDLAEEELLLALGVGPVVESAAVVGVTPR